MIKNLKLKIINYLEKLRALPDKQKKIILWTIVIILALGFGFFWIKTTISRFAKIEESIKKIDIPLINISSIEEKK